MEICDIINHTEEGPGDAVKAIKKRLHQCMGRNSKTALYTLTILETCAKNCRLYNILSPLTYNYDNQETFPGLDLFPRVRD